jgi:hypothetical protein
VTTGLRLLSAYLPALPTRLAALSASCAHHLESLRWPQSGAHAVRILSRVPGMPPEPGEAMQGSGGIISCLMLDVSASYNANGVHNTNANPDRMTGTRRPYTPVACRRSCCCQRHSFTHWLHVQPGRCSGVTLTRQSHDRAGTQRRKSSTNATRSRRGRRAGTWRRTDQFRPSELLDRRLASAVLGCPGAEGRMDNKVISISAPDRCGD